MPYFIQQTDSGWDTVKDDGTVLGKHKTKKQAIDQMVAVSIAEKIAPGGELKRAVEAGTYQPPQGVADAAKRALKWIDEGKAGSGFTAVGRRRASQLASGESVSADVVNRMLSYFARHEVDKQATGFSSGEEGFPSAGRVAWDAWGGDAGQSWVNGLDNKMSVRAIVPIGITDLDDTLVVGGVLHQDYYDWLDHQGVDLYIVTGRNESDREATLDQLDEYNIQYRELLMKPDDVSDSNEWKGTVAKQLIEDGNTVAFAVDNNPEARAAYNRAGVPEVLDPKTIKYDTAPAVREVMDVYGKVTELKGEVLELIGKLASTVYEVCELVDSLEPSVEVPTGSEDVVEDVVETDSTRFVDPVDVVEIVKRGERVTKGIERRQIVRDLEIRQEGDGMTLRGYAAVFNSASQPLPFIERIQPGAFRASLQSRNDIKLLWNHDTGTVLGSTRAGTLTLTEDEHGLLVEASLPDTQAGRDAATLIKRGDVNAFSFGFRVPANGDEWPNANERILKRVNIHEVSLVAFPAYTATEGTASVRSMSDFIDRVRELAEKRGVQAEELVDALLAVENGEELTERQGELLTEVLPKVLKQTKETIAPADLLDLKKKQLDLLMKKV